MVAKMKLLTGYEYYLYRQQRLRSPHIGVDDDYRKVYEQNQIEVGWPMGPKRMFDGTAKPNFIALAGGAYGDEGKGRITDNKIESLLSSKKKLKIVRVIAYNGGNNAGRTVENDKIRIAVHALPAGILYEQTQAIIDQGTISHIGDLQSEIEHVTSLVGSLRGKVYLSEKAILCTDLERAEEELNAEKIHYQKARSQLAGGTTKKGIATSYAHHYDKTGLHVYDILAGNWRDTLSARYDSYNRQFSAFQFDLSTVRVSDFRETKRTGTNQTHPVGKKKEFLERLASARNFLISSRIACDTMSIHEDTLSHAETIGVIFEGVQGAGIDAWIGARPDVTSSTTTMYGIASGTGYWQLHDIADRIAVIKGPYTSSVGARHLITEIPIGKNVRSPADVPENAPPEHKRASFIREKAREFGTTSGRPRDIARLDLAQTIYNVHMSGAEVLAVTLMDCAREGELIEVATHYTRRGKPVPFHPWLMHQDGITPHYIKLPGWDGEKANKAKTFNQLPKNAQKYLAFLQTRICMPIVAVTVGPKRENLITLPGYDAYIQ